MGTNKTVIIVIDVSTMLDMTTLDKAEPECYSSLAAVCRVKGWKYCSVSRKKLPVEYRGVRIWRVDFTT